MKILNLQWVKKEQLLVLNIIFDGYSPVVLKYYKNKYSKRILNSFNFLKNSKIKESIGKSQIPYIWYYETNSFQEWTNDTFTVCIHLSIFL